LAAVQIWVSHCSFKTIDINPEWAMRAPARLML
jgi:hypothetical protein